MFNILIGSEDRPNRLEVKDKDAAYHSQYAKFCISNAFNHLHYEFMAKVIPFIPEDYGFVRHADHDTDDMKHYELGNNEDIVLMRSRRSPMHCVLFQTGILNAHVRIMDDRSAKVLFIALDLPVNYGVNTDAIIDRFNAIKEEEGVSDEG